MNREVIQVCLDQVTLGRIDRRTFLAALGASVLALPGIEPALAQAENAALQQVNARASGQDSFDYVIVGGGTAGCIIAHRLVEDGASVCVIEAGDDPRGVENTDIPAKWPMLIGSDLDWKFSSTPQAGADGRTIYEPRGLALGGSSATNAMMYLRPDANDLRSWGAPEWERAALLPYFMRAENFGKDAKPSKGNAGPFQIETVAMVNPIAGQSLAAATELGFATGDLNAGIDTGAGPLDLAIHDGVRVDTARAYLFPILDRENIAVLIKTKARRLVFDGTRCAGVAVAGDAGERVIHATREVLLTAGAVGSPHLLMNSGVGNPGDLKAAGVDLVTANARVGLGLQDHMIAYVAHFRAKSQLPPPQAIGGETYLMAALEDGNPGRNAQVLFAQVPLATQAFDFLEGFSFAVAMTRPESRGSVRLNPDDPSGAPLIDPAYLQTQKDVDALVAGYELASELGNAKAFDELRAEQVDKIEGDRAAMMRQRADCYYHLAGSCGMGAEGDGAVGFDLKVHGVDGLRVADASVMPRIVTVNTMATVIAIAEKAADLVGS